jgi:hypothetical protein
MAMAGKTVRLLALPDGTGTEDGTEPVVLRPAPVPDPGTEPGTPVLDPAGTVEPMTVPERAGTAVRYRAARMAAVAYELWLHPDRLLHSIWHPRPETLAEHRVYIKSQAWVPPEMTGRAATVIRWAGIAYHVFIGHPLKAAMKAAVKGAQNVDQAAERPMRIGLAAVFVSVIVLILLHL